MDTSMFDWVAKRLAVHKLSRRSALGVTGGVVASVAIPSEILAQDSATPLASPGVVPADSADDIMFVQGFGGGTLEPKAEDPNQFTLTLTEGLGYTVYFTDRPDRQFGAVPTLQFLGGFNFSGDNPPNAAMVMETDDGLEQVVVIELTNPIYDDATHTANYDAKILGDFEDLRGRLQQEPVSAADVEPAFRSAHLFIDSCSTEAVHCMAAADGCDEGNCGAVEVGSLGTMGFCWSFGDTCCHPCSHSDRSYWDQRCNNTFAECKDKCAAEYTGCF